MSVTRRWRPWPRPRPAKHTDWSCSAGTCWIATTTRPRFVVLAPGAPQVDPDDDKTTLVFRTAHTPGALALALTELGLRGANLTRIESRPATERWSYRFFVDLIHDPGPKGLAAVIDPPPATCAELKVLGSYRAAGA